VKQNTEIFTKLFQHNFILHLTTTLRMPDKAALSEVVLYYHQKC